ncbi:MAG: glycosyltransferase [Planctomycetes bacterium]|nr:glycosyltransferase [Planctomycetota bacterium]
MKILYLTSRLPYPPVGGDRLRTHAFLKFLSKKHEIDLLSIYDSDSELQYISQLAAFCGDIHLFKRNKFISYVNLFRSFADHNPFQVNYYDSSSVRKFIKKIYRKYDCILVHLIRMAQYVVGLPVKKIIDMTDCLSELWYEQSKFSSFPMSQLYKLEARYIKRYEDFISSRFDYLLYVTSDEFSSKHSSQNVVSVGNGFNMDDLNGYSLGNKDGIGFVGKLDTFPNKDAVNYFIKNIFPEVRREIPDMKFYIIGKNPSPEWSAVDNCVVTGEVAHVGEYLSKCYVFVCPLRCGAGFKNKIVEAMLHKVPVVASSISIKGMGFIPREHIILEDNPLLFAKQVINLLKNEGFRLKIADKAYNFTKSNFSWEQELQKVDKILCSIT